MFLSPISTSTRLGKPLLSSILLRPAFRFYSHPKSRAIFRSHATMNAQELSSYLADAPPSVVRLEAEKHFVALSDKQKRYAHFISRYGSQI